VKSKEDVMTKFTFIIPIKDSSDHFDSSLSNSGSITEYPLTNDFSSRSINIVPMSAITKRGEKVKKKYTLRALVVDDEIFNVTTLVRMLENNF
jgi:hypothetical protein